MAAIIVGTDYVLPDEGAFILKELEERAPDSHGYRRYQIIHVWRNEAMAVYRRDLGPVEQWPYEQFQIVGGGWKTFRGITRPWFSETVQNLQEMADYMRSDYYQPAPVPEPYDLVQGFHDSFEKAKLRRVNRSQFGPVAVIQRS